MDALRSSRNSDSTSRSSMSDQLMPINNVNVEYPLQIQITKI